MSKDTNRATTGKAEFEPSVLIEYGDAAELTQVPDNQNVTEDTTYLS